MPSTYKGVVALHALDQVVGRLTKGQYTLMPVDVLDHAREPINFIAMAAECGDLHSNYVQEARKLEALDDAIYTALCGRWCDVQNHPIFVAYRRRFNRKR